MTKTIFLAFLLLVSWVSTADALTWWLSPSGTPGTCSQARGSSDPGLYLNSFADLNACTSPALASGDTVMLKGGTYTEWYGAGGFTLPNGTLGAPTILQAVGTEVVTFTEVDAGAFRSVFTFNGDSYISLLGDANAKNFQLNTVSTNCLSSVSFAGGSTGIVLDGMDISNCTEGNGVSIFFNSDGNTFRNLRVHDNGGVQVGVEQNHGMYLDTSDNVFENLEIDHNSGYGFHCNDAGGAENNIFSNINSHHNGTTEAAGFLLCSGSGNVYYNMIIWKNTGARGIQADGGGTDIIVNGVTLYNNAGREIFLRGGSDNGTYTNIIIYNDIGSLFISDGGSGNDFVSVFCNSPETGCTDDGDPLFVLPESGNFHLQEGSPAASGATTLSSPYNVDMDGVNRPQGATFAYGAFEFVEPPSPELLVLQISCDNVVTDSSGEGNNGTLTNGATYATGKYNNGCSFDGTNDYVSIADDASLDVDGFTIQAWVKPTTVDATDRVLLAKSGSYFLYATSSNAGCPGGIRGGFIDVATGVKAVCYNTPLTAGVWVNLALKYDGTTITLYVNGTPVTSNSVGGSIVQNSSVVAIGANGTGGEELDGMIDEIRMRNFAVADAQIVTDMNTSINAITPTPGAPSIALGASSTALKLGASSAAIKFGAPTQ